MDKTVLLNKSMNEMTKTERDYLRNQLNERDMAEITNQLAEVKNNQEKFNVKLGIIEKTQEENKDEIDRLKQETNVLCAPIHHKRRNKFRKKAASRVRFLLGNDKAAPEYILFSAYFFKGIYADIAYQLELGNWDDMSMENYENPDSTYETAKEIRDNWRPEYKYFKRCLKELIEKRDNGILRPEKCRALTGFLNSTNNGKNVSFL